MTTQNSFNDKYEQLVSMILKAEPVKSVFLLAGSVITETVTSAFCETPLLAQHQGDYIVLVLVKDEKAKLMELQEVIENSCRSFCNTTAFVQTAYRFNEWLSSGYPFAKCVRNNAPLIYDDGTTLFADSAKVDDEEEKASNAKFFTEGLNRSIEFLAGSDLYRLRNQNRLAAFSLHQAIEQALLTLLQAMIGYRATTHNIDRLLRYSRCFTLQLTEVFPMKSDKDKHLFTLLQKAYIDSRYKKDYNINREYLLILEERAKKIQELMVTICKEKIS